MHGQAITPNHDAMFEQLLDELDAAFELSILPDRDLRLPTIAAHCAKAARLTAEALDQP